MVCSVRVGPSQVKSVCSCDGFAVGGEALFGDPAAEGVVEVAPGGAVGGDDGGEAVFGVPGVVPGVGLRERRVFWRRVMRPAASCS